MNTRKLEQVRLWPGDAPLSRGSSSEDQPTLTPYLPADNILNAGIVVCPGGGYGGLAAHEGEPVALWLNSLGIAAFVLKYRVAPYRHPAPLLDAQRALRLVRSKVDEWAVSPGRLGILGFSAGGHLATSAATLFDEFIPDSADSVDRLNARPDALIACYPVITFGPSGHQGSCKNLLAAADGSIDPVLREQLSLENRVTENTPPSFLWHTADDAGVPVENSLLFAQALRRGKVPFSLHVFPHGSHGLGLAQQHNEVSVWPDLCEEWLESLGFMAD